MTSGTRAAMSTGMKLTVMLLALAITTLFACDKSNPSSSSSAATPTTSAPSTPTAPPAGQLPGGLTRVTDPSQVCMVNDQFMGKPQIPIEVEGRTYYGCCPMCKDRLANQPESRRGTDPVSGKPVDKASAIMVKDASGKILYFESEANLGKYTL